MTRYVLNLSSIEVDVSNFAVADKANLILIDTVAKPNGDREATFQSTSGDDVYPMTARVGAYPPKGSSELYNLSFRLNTYVQDNQGADPDLFKPGFCTVATGMPFGFVPDAAGLVKLIQHCVSIAIPVLLGIATTEALDELKFGVVSNVMGHVDSGS